MTFGFARGDFDGSRHGADYLRLRRGDSIALLTREARHADDPSWSYGLANGRGPGWFPTECFEGAGVQGKPQEFPAPVASFVGRRFGGRRADAEHLERVHAGGTFAEGFSAAFAARVDDFFRCTAILEVGAGLVVSSAGAVSIRSLGDGQGSLQMVVTCGGQERRVSAAGALFHDVEHQYLCSVSARGVMTIHRDGVVLADGGEGGALPSAPWTHADVAMSRQACCENFSGSIRNLRLWDACVPWEAVPWAEPVTGDDDKAETSQCCETQSHATQTDSERGATLDVSVQTSLELPAKPDAGAEVGRRDELAPLGAVASSGGGPSLQAESGGAAATLVPASPASPSTPTGSPQELQGKIMARLTALAADKQSLEAALAARAVELRSSEAAAAAARHEATQAAARHTRELERLRTDAAEAERRAMAAEGRLGAGRLLGAARRAFHPPDEAVEATLSVHWEDAGEEQASPCASQLRGLLDSRGSRLRVGAPPRDWQTWLQLGLRHGAYGEPALLRMQAHGSGADTHLGLMWPAPQAK